MASIKHGAGMKGIKILNLFSIIRASSFIFDLSLIDLILSSSFFSMFFAYVSLFLLKTGYFFEDNSTIYGY